MMKKYPSFVLRRVKSGRIKFDGILWEPQEPTNRLDGLRFAFGVYVEGRLSSPVRRLETLCLWGTERAYRASRESEEAFDRACAEESPLLSPDGYLRQYWWHPVGKG